LKANNRSGADKEPWVSGIMVLVLSRHDKSGAKMFGFEVENDNLESPDATLGEGDSSNWSEDIAEDTPGDFIADNAGLSLADKLSFGDTLD
jgi:hypothetical protein